MGFVVLFREAHKMIFPLSGKYTQGNINISRMPICCGIEIAV